MDVHSLVSITTITSPGFLRWKRMFREGIAYIFYTVWSPLYQATDQKDCRQLEVNNYYSMSSQGPGSLCRTVPSNRKKNKMCSVAIHIPTKLDEGSNRKPSVLIYTAAFHGTPSHG